MRPSRLAALALALACAAAAPLRAGEVRVSGEAPSAAAAPASIAAPVALPGLSASLSPADVGTATALPSSIALPAAAPAPRTYGAVDSLLPAASAAQAPGEAAAEVFPGKGLAAESAAAQAAAAGRSEISETGGNVRQASWLVQGRGEAHPGDKPSSLARPALAHARRIAAALGLGPAAQDLPLESGASRGAARLAAYRHVPERVDDGAPRNAPAPSAPQPGAGRGLKRLFGPALALALTLLPSLAHANPFAGLGPGPKFTVTLPLLVLAGVIALVRLPVTRLLAYTNPHSLGDGDGGSDRIARLHPVVMAPVVFFFAGIEEFTYRGVGFVGGVVLLTHWLPHLHGMAAAAYAGGIYAAAALISSWIFAISHKYSELWPRFIGGLVYCAALVMTGSLLFPTLIHAFYNMVLLLQRRAELRKEEAA